MNTKNYDCFEYMKIGRWKKKKINTQTNTAKILENGHLWGIFDKTWVQLRQYLYLRVVQSNAYTVLTTEYEHYNFQIHPFFWVITKEKWKKKNTQKEIRNSVICADSREEKSRWFDSILEMFTLTRQIMLSEKLHRNVVINFVISTLMYIMAVITYMWLQFYQKNDIIYIYLFHFLFSYYSLTVNY